MKKYLGLFILLLLLSSATLSQAALIRTTWTASPDQDFTWDLFGGAGSINFTAGMIFSITSVYDNANLATAYVWKDGADGKSDFGGGDDTEYYNPGSWAVFGSGDVAPDLSNFILSPDLRWLIEELPDTTFNNMAYHYLENSVETGFNLQADGLSLSFRENRLNISPSSGFFIWEIAPQEGNDNGGSRNQILGSTFTYSKSSAEWSPVPVPSALLLLASGLLGLAGVSRRKKLE